MNFRCCLLNIKEFAARCPGIAQEARRYGHGSGEEKAKNLGPSLPGKILPSYKNFRLTCAIPVSDDILKLPAPGNNLMVGSWAQSALK